MNITGAFRGELNFVNQYNGVFGAEEAYSYTTQEKNGNYWSSYRKVSFDALRSWAGETSSVGGNAAHSLMQPFLSVFMWRRTN